MEVLGEVVIRRATASDLDAVSQVWHQSAAAMDGNPDVPPLEALRRRIEAELQSGWELHVAIRRQRVVGMLALKKDIATLDQIFVAPADQGQGVGAALMRVAKQEMSQGFTLRMAASNARAKRFYENEGLSWLHDGVHPWTGIPVQFYGWNVR